ncbi:alanine--glyoxylate aminotransferase family protein [Immundisolibacter sp.]|uniref:pyridoxal-phosphate-dependent aminotransferase family protein n=1 Tax=Immundisolibacter sp. TaxID=1934948 RepID=UPI0035627D39
MAMASFHPPIRTLMGPGPSDVHPRVLAALARPTIGHLDPAFVGLMDDIKALLRQAFRTENEVTFPISAPGSVGMEACFVNLVEPGDTVIVCRNGVFGGRMKENVERTGGIAVMVDDPWTRAVDPQRLEDALKANPQATLVAFVMAETSTGALSDAKTLVDLAHRHNCLAIVDAVTALGGVPLEVDAWGIDAIYSGTQKCLSCPPGLAPVSFNERALDKIRARSTPVQSWFLDLNLVLGYWSGAARRSYHHTAPINALYGLHEALLMLHEEGLEAAWARHALHHQALRAGLEAMGLPLLGADGERLPQLNMVGIPDGVDDAAARQVLLADFGLEIGAGLGDLAGKAWRIGLMGQSASRRHVVLCLTALGGALAAQGRTVDVGKALAAAQAVYRG